VITKYKIVSKVLALTCISKMKFFLFTQFVLAFLAQYASGEESTCAVCSKSGGAETAAEVGLEQQQSSSHLTPVDKMSHKSSFKALEGVMAIDLSELPTAYQIHADLPGVDKNEIKVDIDFGFLTVSALRKNFNEGDEEINHVKVHHVERSLGKVQRLIRLPHNADSTLAKASFENGVLEIAIPKLKEYAATTNVPIN
jgi:HSP20 family protein